VNFTKRHGCINWEGFKALNIERENILSLMDWCARSDEWRQFIDIEAGIRYFLSFQGYWDELIKLGLQAVEGGIKINNKASSAWSALSSVGWTYRKRSNYNEALKWTQKAHLLFEEIKDTRGKAAALRELGGLAENQSKLEQAKQFYKECILTSGNPIDREAGYDANIDLGDVSFKQGNLVEAEQLYQRQLKWWQEQNDPMWIAILLGKLGYVAYRQNDYKKALELYKQSCQENQRLERQIGIAYSKWAFASINEKLKEFKLAKISAKEALEIFERLGMTKQIKRTTEMINRLEKKLRK